MDRNKKEEMQDEDETCYWSTGHLYGGRNRRAGVDLGQV
jgi:hypothetical protein